MFSALSHWRGGAMIYNPQTHTLKQSVSPNGRMEEFCMNGVCVFGSVRLSSVIEFVALWINGDEAEMW